MTATYGASLSYREQGRVAFGRGAMRLVPRDILVNDGCAAAREWYDGWDAANLAAPVPGMDQLPLDD